MRYLEIAKPQDRCDLMKHPFCPLLHSKDNYGFRIKARIKNTKEQKNKKRKKKKRTKNTLQCWKMATYHIAESQKI